MFNRISKACIKLDTQTRKLQMFQSVSRCLRFLILIKLAVSLGNASEPIVTCGSVIKLLNVDYNVRLHSHEVKYGTGSGQQSVTGFPEVTDRNSYWQVVERNGAPQCQRGRLIKCGQKIRLMHLSTRKNLHSHHFASPLSSNFEVSAFGDDGLGDEGDDWQVVCDTTYWQKSAPISLKHISTDGYLHVTGKRYKSPISGQYEVVGVTSQIKGTKWISTEGVYLSPKETPRKTQTTHDEF